MIRTKLRFLSGWLAVSALLLAGGASRSAYPQGSPAPITIISRTGPDGEYLSTADGKTLYISDGDSKTGSQCTGDCAKRYPLLALQSGQTCTGSGDVQASILESLQLSDVYPREYSTSLACGDAFVNSTSLSRAFLDVPFHISVDDHAPGDVTGKCAKVGNATLYLVRPNGTIIPCHTGPSPTPAAAPAPYPVPYPVPASGGGGSCGSYNVCGWTPGWRCYDPNPYLSQCRPECCSYTGDTSCTGSNSCGGGGSSSCGPFNVCGWTPGWRCNYTVSDSNPPVGYRPECCYNADDSSCRGYS